MSRSTRSARRSILSACARADGCRWSMPPVFPARCGGSCSPARLSISPRRQNSRRWWPQLPHQAFEQMVQQGDGLVSGEHMLRFWNPPFSQQDVEAVLQRNLGDGSDEARMLLDRFERWDRATLDLPGTYYLEVTDQVFPAEPDRERPLCRARPQDRSRRGARAGLPAGRRADDIVVPRDQAFATAAAVGHAAGVAGTGLRAVRSPQPFHGAQRPEPFLAPGRPVASGRHRRCRRRQDQRVR